MWTLSEPLIPRISTSTALRASKLSITTRSWKKHPPERVVAKLRDAESTHRRRLRTNNGPGRLNKQIKRCTRVVMLFPDEASLLRLVTQVPSEIDDVWE